MEIFQLVSYIAVILVLYLRDGIRDRTSQIGPKIKIYDWLNFSYIPYKPNCV